ncbi:hypothetical protein [Aliiroseovarius crassostreae]|uniref:hypothetical protein n=1 Tax=Aliiroseovarius crassostreae TaxID=154981 RepID=UPI00223AB713|nr:hypothetical protein [Aliiroseovarius crassostreae]
MKRLLNTVKIQLQTMWRAAPVATALLILCLIAGGVFATRTITEAVYWANPDHRNQPLAGWMTPRYVAHSWRIPRPDMMDIMRSAAPDLDLENGPKSLGDIAAEHDLALNELLQRIDTGLSAYQNEHPAGDAGQ